jgi:hypothetical protein
MEEIEEQIADLVNKDYSYDISINDQVERQLIIEVDSDPHAFNKSLCSHSHCEHNIIDLALQSMDLDVKLDVHRYTTINNLRNLNHQMSEMNKMICNKILST